MFTHRLELYKTKSLFVMAKWQIHIVRDLFVYVFSPVAFTHSYKCFVIVFPSLSLFLLSLHGTLSHEIRLKCCYLYGWKLQLSSPCQRQNIVVVVVAPVEKHRKSFSLSRTQSADIVFTKIWKNDMYVVCMSSNEKLFFLKLSSIELLL